MCADGELIDRLGVLDVIGRLVDKSLVAAVDSPVPGGDIRYRMLETIRQYALDRCSSADELTPTRDRHLDHYVEWLERLDGLHPSDACQDAIEQDYANIRAALVWAVDAPDKALRLVTQLSYSWANIGRYDDVVRLGRPVLELGRESHQHRWAEAVGALADPLIGALDPSVAALLPAAFAVAEEHGDEATMGRCMFILGIVGPHLGPDNFERGAEHGQRAGDGLVFATNATSRGLWALLRGELEGERWMRDGLEAWDAVGNRGWSLQGASLGTLAPFLRGDLAGAQRIVVDRRRFAMGTVDPISRALYAATMAYAGLLAHDDELLRDSRAVLDEHRGGWPQFFAAAAIAAVTACERLRRDEIVLDGDALELLLHGRWTGWYLDLGTAFTLAAPHPYRAYPTRQGVVDPVDDGPYQRCRAALADAHIAAVNAETTAAEDLAHVALALAVEHGWALVIVDCIETLAGLEDDPVTYSRLLGATDRLRRDMEYRYRWPHLTRLLGERPDTIEEAAFEAGGQLDAAGAVAYASRSRGARKRPAHGWPSLTPTERAVVEHVAAGRTNPQIAERLLMSRATVKTHLAHVFAKLGVATRAELAALAATQRPRSD